MRRKEIATRLRARSAKRLPKSTRGPFVTSEIVIGLVGAAGTDLHAVVKDLSLCLQKCSYRVSELRVSTQVIPRVVRVTKHDDANEFERIMAHMDAGDESRRISGDNAILASGAAAKIFGSRPGSDQHGSEAPRAQPRRAYIINSLKRPEEVEQLREIYAGGFYLVGVYTDEDKRMKYLTDNGRMKKAQATRLMKRDEDEEDEHGQLTRDTFHLADFFIHDANNDTRRNSLWRITEILFGHPYRTPTFDEFAMFMAFASALRSADLSRQVGAVVAKHEEIIATGANDCPRFGGGLYWPAADLLTGLVTEFPEGRDHKRGFDSNAREKERIADDLYGRLKPLLKRGVRKDQAKEVLSKGRIKDITEYGRVVHAEMEALLSCARNNVDCRGATLYCTTFPCHNCAKHLIAAGIRRVVYVEPYPKSKAPEFHDDSMALGFRTEPANSGKACFEPFVGVGPRNFLNLFSVGLGTGYKIERERAGLTLNWKAEDAILRVQMLPYSYVERETDAAAHFEQCCSR